MSLINSKIVSAKICVCHFLGSPAYTKYKVLIRQGGFCFTTLTRYFPTRVEAQAYAATRKDLVAALELFRRIA